MVIQQLFGRIALLNKILLCPEWVLVRGRDDRICPSVWWSHSTPIPQKRFFQQCKHRIHSNCWAPPSLLGAAAPGEGDLANICQGLGFSRTLCHNLLAWACPALAGEAEQQQPVPTVTLAMTSEQLMPVTCLFTTPARWEHRFHHHIPSLLWVKV